ncbi:MAG: DUF1540 domain-containing protein [Clostridium sp.]|nr:DUF1540 domain-containing protein [Clostridium sp.]
MSNLICSAANCVYNADGLCSAKDIHIGIRGISSRAEDTDCVTFLKGNIKNSFVSITNMNISGEIKQFVNSDNMELKPNIICDAASCIHNSSGMCSARDVQIYEEAQNTNCETFKMKV